MKYRKKPIIVEAMQFIDEIGIVAKIIEWAARSNGCIQPRKEGLLVHTKNGPLFALREDYIIKGPGYADFYPCRPGIFEQTYEKVECDEAN